jgi:gliding motility-associated-like protein
LQATGATSYNWYPSFSLNNPNIQNPIATPNETTYYIVEATNSNGCANSDTVLITVSDDFLLIPYNIVTPDGNGKNDVWVVQNIESYPNNTVTILDEWGVVVFEQTSYDNTWNGINKQGNILPDGTYYYIVTLKDANKIYKGFVTLLRNK